VHLAIAVTAFALVFVAELPDKTALASVVLGTRFRPLPVFAGVAAALAVQVGLAVAAGSLVGLLPHRVVAGVAAALFAVSAGLLLRRRGPDGPDGGGPRAGVVPQAFRRAAAASFAIVAVAEFGDLTQVVIANLAARYRDPLSVGAGSALALWSVAALAIAGGRALLGFIPLRLVTRLAAAAMGAMAVVCLASAISG
jgi:Ca2+/H+ antiporter, TMEM165/GDT1 family